MARRYYWWLSAVNDGKPYLIYGGLTEEEAREKGLEMLGGIDFEIRRLPTRDLATASSYVRGKRLEATHSLHEARQRIGHTKSIRRINRRV